MENLSYQQEWSLQDVHVHVLPFSGMDLDSSLHVSPLNRKQEVPSNFLSLYGF